MSELKKLLVLFLIGFPVLLGMGISRSYAEVIVPFNPSSTKIIGSIPYSVIGRYIAHFNNFKGRITLDEDLERVRSVYLEIEADSIESNCPWCDKIARSRRLLNTARYPKVIFKSEMITQDKCGYKVRGILRMHGIKRRLTFPFKAEIIIDQKTKRTILDLNGSWSINRKDFNIDWNRYLDRGGVLVGDHFTVNWGIKVYKKLSVRPNV